MQTLDIISLNLWQTLASLLNLVLLFWVIKKFLYQPVRKMLDARQAKIEGDYDAARLAKERALEEERLYAEKLAGAKDEAQRVIHAAVETASRREAEILDEAKQKAEGIVRQAETDALLERKKSEEEIKREIVEVSSLLTEKLLERELNAEDHEALIDSFLNDLGADDGEN